MILKNSPLSSLLIAHNIIEKDGLDYIINFAKNNEKFDTKIFNVNEKDNKKIDESGLLDKNVRNAKIVNITKILPDLTELYNDVVKNIINVEYEFIIKDSELPQLLYYTVGGHYEPHNDSEGLWKPPRGEEFWRIIADRHLSSIIYLNDDFEGGELFFPEFSLEIKPKKGMLVCFPSNHFYSHTVKPVTKGERFCLVNWFRVEGMQTKEEQDKEILEKYGVN